MAITLKKPFNPGDNDTGKAYTHARIESVNIDLAGRRMGVLLVLGAFDTDGKWLKGAASPSMSMLLEGEDFAKGTRVQTEDGETVYDALARSLYDTLLEKKVVEGTRT